MNRSEWLIFNYYSLKTSRRTKYFYSLLFIFPKESAMYAIESSLPLSGVNIFNMDAVSGIITTKISLQSGSYNFYQV